MKLFMKKYLGVLVIATFLVLPLNAFAGYLYTDNMHISGSGDGWNGWATDYETSDGVETFCVENVNLLSSDVAYDFYTIDSSLIAYGSGSLGSGIDSNYVALLTETTWYANSWATGSASKTDAQVAIWKTLFHSVTTAGTTGAISLMSDYNDALNDGTSGDYVSDWLFAVSPGGNPENITIGEVGQNFLVAAPVPEPTTMLLFGTGLIGLAGVARRKKK